MCLKFDWYLNTVDNEYTSILPTQADYRSPIVLCSSYPPFIVVCNWFMILYENENNYDLNKHESW